MLKHKGKEREKMREETKISPQNLSRLGQSFFLTGELSGDEDLAIKGHFQGKIDLGSHNLTIEQGAKIKADIRANNIIIQGEIRGNIHASGKVFISKEAQMIGDIFACRISIMDGAQFKGSIKMEKLSESVASNKT